MSPHIARCPLEVVGKIAPVENHCYQVLSLYSEQQRAVKSVIQVHGMSRFTSLDNHYGSRGENDGALADLETWKPVRWLTTQEP